MKLLNSASDRFSSIRLPESRRFWITTAVLVLIVEIALSISFWNWLSGGESGSTTVRNIGFMIAGSVALPLAIWRATVADRQASAAQCQAAIAQRGLLNERYQKGAEMLGNERLPVRLGGIYALQQLAEDHLEGYHRQAMRLLCTFVRYPSRSQRLAGTGQSDEKGSPIRPDVGAAIDAIAYRSDQAITLETEYRFTVHLNSADLRGAKLAHAKLTGAVLRNANLAHAKLRHANLVDTDLVNVDMCDADFYRANLCNADLTNTKLINARFVYANLTRAYLNDAKAAKADFREAIMEGVDLSKAIMPCATLVDANLTGARLIGAKLPGANFIGTELHGARLTSTKLSDATLEYANLYGASLKDANLSGANLMHVTSLTQAQLDEARADPDKPPKLDGVLDAETGEQLVWRGKPLNDGA